MLKIIMLMLSFLILMGCESNVSLSEDDLDYADGVYFQKKYNDYFSCKVLIEDNVVTEKASIVESGVNYVIVREYRLEEGILYYKMRTSALGVYANVLINEMCEMMHEGANDFYFSSPKIVCEDSYAEFTAQVLGSSSITINYFAKASKEECDDMYYNFKNQD